MSIMNYNNLSLTIEGKEYELIPKKKEEKREWEIVEFAHGNRTHNIRDYSTAFDFQKYATNSNVEIQSVVRTLDNEVFSVGDKIYFGFNSLPGFAAIQRFEIDYFDNTQITAFCGAFGRGYKAWKKETKNETLYNTPCLSVKEIIEETKRVGYTALPDYEKLLLSLVERKL